MSQALSIMGWKDKDFCCYMSVTSFISERLVSCLCSWLLSDSSMRLRTMYPGFTQAVDIYFDKLIPKMVPLQVK